MMDAPDTKVHTTSGGQGHESDDNIAKINDLITSPRNLRMQSDTRKFYFKEAYTAIRSIRNASCALEKTTATATALKEIETLQFIYSKQKSTGDGESALRFRPVYLAIKEFLNAEAGEKSAEAWGKLAAIMEKT